MIEGWTEVAVPSEPTFAGYALFNNSVTSNSWYVGELDFKIASTLYEADITSMGLVSPPTYASKRNTPELALAIGLTTDVFITSDFDKLPDGYTLSVSGADLKLVGNKVTFADNPDFKQIGLAVNEPVGMKFSDAKIYIQERS